MAACAALRTPCLAPAAPLALRLLLRQVAVRSHQCYTFSRNNHISQQVGAGTAAAHPLACALPHLRVPSACQFASQVLVY